MRIPRDVNGRTLVKLLQPLGYEVSRQAGSHIRLTMTGDPAHHVTIPAHAPLRVGTLNAILADVARHLGMTKEALAERLFVH